MTASTTLAPLVTSPESRKEGDSVPDQLLGLPLVADERVPEDELQLRNAQRAFVARITGLPSGTLAQLQGAEAAMSVEFANLLRTAQVNGGAPVEWAVHPSRMAEVSRPQPARARPLTREDVALLNAEADHAERYNRRQESMRLRDLATRIATHLA